MLRFRIDRADLSSGWQSASDGYARGRRSHVTPYRNAALEDFVVTSGDATLFVVRERLASRPRDDSARGAIEAVSPERFAEIVREVRAWPLEFVALTVTSGEASIEAGRWGSAPVYLAEAGDALIGEWDPVELYRYLGPDPLDPVCTAHFLAAFSHPYSRQTLLGEVAQLTERSVARWSRDASLTLQYPEAIPPPAPRHLKPAADVVAIFQEILTAAVSRWLATARLGVAAELSSGLDSGVVSASAASFIGGGLPTYGLIMLGSEGELQQARRRELIRRFGHRDTSFSAAPYWPLSADGPRLREARVVPWEEIYYEAMDRMLRLASEGGAAIMLTGVGGDELCLPHWFETPEGIAECRMHRGEHHATPAFLTERTVSAYRDTLTSIDHAPQPSMSVSSIESCAVGAPLYLRHGLWPVSPLCTKELVWFCRSLPREWRDGRRIQRELLLRLGCSRDVAYPASTESFSAIFEQSMLDKARPLVRRLFAASRLADEGYVDRDRLLTMYDAYCARGGGGDDGLDFYSVAMIELTLRSIDARRGRAEAAPIELP